MVRVTAQVTCVADCHVGESELPSADRLRGSLTTQHNVSVTQGQHRINSQDGANWKHGDHDTQHDIGWGHNPVTCVFLEFG